MITSLEETKKALSAIITEQHTKMHEVSQGEDTDDQTVNGRTLEYIEALVMKEGELNKLAGNLEQFDQRNLKKWKYMSSMNKTLTRGRSWLRGTSSLTS